MLSPCCILQPQRGSKVVLLGLGIITEYTFKTLKFRHMPCTVLHGMISSLSPVEVASTVFTKTFFALLCAKPGPSNLRVMSPSPRLICAVLAMATSVEPRAPDPKIAESVEPRAPDSIMSGSKMEKEGYLWLKKQQSREWNRMWAVLSPPG